jgi:hypothetical protein
MDAKRFLTGTVVGGIVLFVAGYVIFNIALAGFFEANAGTATGVPRMPPLLWSIAIGCLGFAALICYAMGARAASGLAGGAKVGAVVGFLMAFAIDFILYGAQNVSTLAATLVDPIASAVHGATGGAAIGLVVSKMKSGA